jgi:DNA-binding MurR/RpiR family transcriptional regulator
MKASVAQAASRPGSAATVADASAIRQPPQDMAELKQWIARESSTLSRVTMRIARFALENPTEMAIDNGAELATVIGVSRTSVSRFASALGFENHAELRRFFQKELISRQNKDQS